MTAYLIWKRFPPCTDMCISTAGEKVVYIRKFLLRGKKTLDFSVASWHWCSRTRYIASLYSMRLSFFHTSSSLQLTQQIRGCLKSRWGVSYWGLEGYSLSLQGSLLLVCLKYVTWGSFFWFPLGGFPLNHQFLVIVLPGEKKKHFYMSPTRAAFFLSRQNEQTCPPGDHTQMSTPAKLTQTPVKADHLGIPATASLSLGTVVDSLSPRRLQTDTFLPQSCETLMSLLVFSPLIHAIHKELFQFLS